MEIYEVSTLDDDGKLQIKFTNIINDRIYILRKFV